MRLLGPAARGLAPPHLLPPAVYHTPRVVVVSSRLDYVSVTRDTSPGRGRRGGLYILYAGGRVKSARWIQGNRNAKHMRLYPYQYSFLEYGNRNAKHMRLYPYQYSFLEYQRGKGPGKHSVKALELFCFTLVD
ncbi:hypothetical protein OsJ_10311 [Oryza sativa Japonica Group]|uniref:Uncharacterized protein n=1 Tax=Oryza sativa subsp. japonica TaxID=39947 RepID=A3AGI7_ORYSJ|nr:hypothetical protein OsJ_10311 [Oryza sativa Japonica Group]